MESWNLNDPESVYDVILRCQMVIYIIELHAYFFGVWTFGHLIETFIKKLYINFLSKYKVIFFLGTQSRATPYSFL